jgi:MerC mercury resistance protein
MNRTFPKNASEKVMRNPSMTTVLALVGKDNPQFATDTHASYSFRKEHNIIIFHLLPIADVVPWHTRCFPFLHCRHLFRTVNPTMPRPTAESKAVEIEQSASQKRPRIRTLWTMDDRDCHHIPLFERPLPRHRNNEDPLIYCVEISRQQQADHDTKEVSKLRRNLAKFRQRSLLETLQRYSTIASWLCLIDCIILPIFTLVIPLLGLANLGPKRLEMLHSIGDFTTIYFLLPVGALSTTLNYYTLSRRKQRWIAALGAVGLTLVALANSYSLPGIGHVQLFHFLHQGLWHRVVNAVGCFCLLGSNQLSSHYQHAGHGHTKRGNETSCCILHENVSTAEVSAKRDDSYPWRRRRRRRPQHPRVMEV